MRKLWDVLILTLAMNFIAAVALVGWAWSSGKIDRQKIGAIREIIAGATTQLSAAAAAQPAAATTRPSDGFAELLSRHGHLPVTQQLDLVRRSFDAQMAMLDRRQREIEDRQHSVQIAQGELADARKALLAEQQKLRGQIDEAQRLAGDKGFQDSLERYETLPAKQVKSIFMSLDDATVIRYLQAMEPRTAGKILKEFKEPAEIERVKTIMEKMRLAKPPSEVARTDAGKEAGRN